MNEHDIINAIGGIDEDLIVNAEKIRKKKKSFPLYKLTAVAASAFLCFGCVYMAYHFASLKDITKYEGSIQGSDTHYETEGSIQETDTHYETEGGISTESVNGITDNTASDISTEKDPEENSVTEIIPTETDAIEVTDIITLPPAQEDTKAPPTVPPPPATDSLHPPELPEVKITVTGVFENGIYATVNDGMTSFLDKDNSVTVKFNDIILISRPAPDGKRLNTPVQFSENLFKYGETLTVQFYKFENSEGENILYSNYVIF